MRISNHAMTRYMTRMGVSFSPGIEKQVITMVEQGTIITPKRAIELGFKLTKLIRRDIYVEMYDHNTAEVLLGIIAKDNTLKTILTKDMFIENSQKAELLRQRAEGVEELVSTM